MNIQRQSSKLFQRDVGHVRKWTGLVAVGIFCSLCVPVTVPGAAAASDSSDLSVTVMVPESGSLLWIDVDSPSGQSSQLSGEIRNNAGWSALPLKQTVFGLGAVVSVRPGTVEFRLRSAADTDPDLSLTVVDASGTVLKEARARLALAGTPKPVPETGEPAPGATSEPTPGATPGATPVSTAAGSTSPTNSSAASNASPADRFLATTGVSLLGTLVVAGGLLVAGLLSITIRRRLRGIR